MNYSENANVVSCTDSTVSCMNFENIFYDRKYYDILLRNNNISPQSKLQFFVRIRIQNI